MATPKFNAKSPTIKRILREAHELSSSPSPDFHAAPASDADLFDWHFTLRGPPSSSYANGHYHGRIVLPPTYPLRPPMFRFLTPSGRFEVNREICLSISGHHEETWSPSWGIRTALTALRSFMETDAKGQLGGLECTKEERARLAGASASWKCGICKRSNKEILDESAEAARVKAEEEGEAAPKEEEVPLQMKIAYKKVTSDSDASGGEGQRQGDAASTTSEENQEALEDEVRLLEGFVQTGNREDSMETPATQQSYPPARPAQTVPQPTSPSITQPIANRPPQVTAAPAFRPQQVAQRRSNDGVPIWLDRTIAAVVVCLVAMVLKVMLGI